MLIKHATARYILSPTHPLRVALVGAGGTGSHVLGHLVKIHLSLKAFGHPGLDVTVYDPDIVTSPNLGRQLFFPAEVGLSKSEALVGRYNNFGLNWRAVAEKFNVTTASEQAFYLPNVLISCVDNREARQEIYLTVADDAVATLKNQTANHRARENALYYWLDFGNATDSGQMIMGTFAPIDQPVVDEQLKDELCFNGRLPHLFDLHPELWEPTPEDVKNVPSCSLAEALAAQDLFVNPEIAQRGMRIFWQLFRKVHMRHHGFYFNLESDLQANLKIPAPVGKSVLTPTLLTL